MMILEHELGPLVNDEQFFRDCLNLDYPGMEEVRQAVLDGDYHKARHCMAAYIRAFIEPQKILSIPYEKPENIVLYPNETEAQACERIMKHVLISVGVPCDYGTDNPVDWYANPTHNQYAEWTWQLNRHHEWKILAHEFNRTGDVRLARTAAELFHSWVRQVQYPGDVSGYDTKGWRTIECGIRMGSVWPYVLFSFVHTEAFTDSLLIDWYKSVWEHGQRLSRNFTRCNWLIMEMNGLAQIGILYPQFRQSEQWRQDAFRHLEEELSKQLYADGFQYELSTGYHDVVINNYQRLAEVARQFQVELPSSMMDRLENSCEIDLKLMMPDGTLPDLNDGKRISSRELLEPKLRIFPDNPHFRFVVSGGTAGQLPNYHSIALEHSGFMVMRNGWDASSTYALFDGAPFGRAHQHEDKLSLILYAQGKYLVPEAGNYAYDDSEMRRYVLSTRGHNTIRVDGMDQNRRSHYQWEDADIQKPSNLKWHIGTDFEYAENTYSEGYGPACDQSVTHTRSVYFVKQPPCGLEPFFLVVDRMQAKEPHCYELLWHVDSDVTARTDCSMKTRELDVLLSCQPEDQCSLQIVSGQTEPEWQGFIAVSTKQGDYRPVNCMQARLTGSNLRIVSVLYPHPQPCGMIVSVQAGTALDDRKIRLHLNHETELTFDEFEMQKN